MSLEANKLNISEAPLALSEPRVVATTRMSQKSSMMPLSSNSQTNENHDARKTALQSKTVGNRIYCSVTLLTTNSKACEVVTVPNLLSE